MTPGAGAALGDTQPLGHRSFCEGPNVDQRPDKPSTRTDSPVHVTTSGLRATAACTSNRLRSPSIWYANTSRTCDGFRVAKNQIQQKPCTDSAGQCSRPTQRSPDD